MKPIELVTTGVAVGGDAIARDADGRVVFVEGALAGERVLVEIGQTRASFRRGTVVEVVDAAAGRIEPVCGEVGRGCGGCDLAHASATYQREAKALVVADALQRVGRLSDHPPVGAGPDLATTGFRTTVRAGVVDGRAGLRRRRSHQVLRVAGCRVAHPLVEELLTEGRFGDASEVTIRVGARTGERMVVTDGAVDLVAVPDDVVVVGPDGTGGHVIHEEVAGRRFRISPRSFFQTRADGADALVAVVGGVIASSRDGGSCDGGTLVDLCAGVGLFGATVGVDAGFDRVVAVESNRSSVADARVNLPAATAGIDPTDAPTVAVVASTFERWAPERADVVIADPSRAGLAGRGVERIEATGAGRVVLVSCDAGSLGRDAGLLVAAGYQLTDVTLVDLFPDTSHVEVVTSYLRAT